MKYCGVGAHHQNGVAERSIQTVSNMARVMMLHASIMWPEMSDPSLWPMAVDYAAHIYNHLPNHKTGQSPMDIFTRSLVLRHGLKDLHVWGCPCYALDPKLQNGQKLPKWELKSRRATFMGVSAIHSSNVPLVLNLSTGHILPQFHVVFDDTFSTVLSIDINDEPPIHWENFFHESRFETVFDEHDKVELADEWLEPDDIACRRDLQKETRVAPLMNLPNDELPSEHQRESCPPQKSMTDTKVVPFNIEHPSTSQQELVLNNDTDKTSTLQSHLHESVLSIDSSPLPHSGDPPPADPFFSFSYSKVTYPSPKYSFHSGNSSNTSHH